MANPVTRVLVIQLARIGDILQTRRLLASLAQDPGVETHLVVDVSLADFAALVHPGLHIHGVAAHGIPGDQAGEVFRISREAIEDLGSRDFDTVYNLNFSGLNFTLASLFDPRRVRGYRWFSGQPIRDLWPSLAFRWTTRRRDTGLNLMDFWAGYATNMVDPKEVNPVPQGRGGGLGVVLSGRHSRRSLPPQLLAAMVGPLLERIGKSRLVLLGTRSDRSASREFIDRLPARFLFGVENLVGRTSLPDLVEVVSGLDLLLTPDTGSMHLAAHVGVPVEAMFLSSAWCFETGPYGAGHRVWQSTLECAPCVETGACGMDRACLEPFSRREVLRIMAGKIPEIMPEHLAIFESGFDDLGVTYRVLAGNDPAQAQREMFRVQVARHLLGEGPGVVNEAPVDWYTEKDWMTDARSMVNA